MAGVFREWRRLAIGAGLFLIVWGGKLMVIDRWGTDLPWWDDWSAIGVNLLVPFQRGELGIGDFFAPHNEHRIAWTRALDLALVALNGQWDARLICVASAALHAGVAVFAAWAGAQLLGPAGRVVWWVAVLAFTAPPVVWENILRGFDSQHYFLIGFSLAAITGLMTAPTGTARWWLGLTAAVAALFTMGSGLTAAFVVGATLLATVPLREVWRDHRWTLLACAVVFLVGWLLRHEVARHDIYRAQNVKEFTIAFWHHLQWPLVHHAWFGAFAWLPWLALARRCIRRDPTTGRAERALVAVGLWALVHYAAMALMRGHLQPWPPTRGLENVVVGLGVNLLALLLWLQRLGRPAPRTWLRWSAAAAGILIVSYGLWGIIRENVTIVLPGIAQHARVVEHNTRAFLVTDDIAWLKPEEIPFPRVESYASVLRMPEIVAVLPASVRPPPPDEGAEAIVPGPVEAAAGSVATLALARIGGWVIAAGAIFLLVSVRWRGDVRAAANV